MSEIENCISGLCDHAKIQRDATLRTIENKISTFTLEEVSQIEEKLLEKLADVSEPWETRHGCLSAGKIIILSSKSSSTFADRFQLVALDHLTDDEARVRLAVGQVLGSLCKMNGHIVYEQCSTIILDLIRQNFTRHLEESNLDQSDGVVTKLIRSHSSDSDGGMEASKVFHDTAGWRSLETSMKCLQEMVEGCGKTFVPYFNRELLDLLIEAVTHTNRFVRETGYFLLGALVSCGASETAYDHIWITELAQWLAKGLADNWSQVRLAASVATRNFVEAFSGDQYYTKTLSILVPAMCLNRYYLAEGVRLYSQESWKRLTGGEGVNFVKNYIKEVTSYYISQTLADNHAVREAACHAIAELGSKIEPKILEEQLEPLLDALIQCFEDESWPVRDAACLACGRFMALFPDSGKPRLEKLLPLFWSQLEDCIPSVRMGAAQSLAKVCSAYGDCVLDWVFPQLENGLKRIQEQKAEDAEKFADMEKGLTQFGVAKRIRDNDPLLHTEQQMFSCGSLAPKMGRSGCGDHTFRRPANPWETTDGCVQLISELSADQKLLLKLIDFLPKIVESSRKRDFVFHVQYLETICRRLPQLAKNFGKRYFKPHLQSFLEPIFYSLSCDTDLTRVAAEDCLSALAQFFGPSIIRGRVEMMNNLDYVNIYDRIVSIK